MMPAEFRTSVIYHCAGCGQPMREVSGTSDGAGVRVWSDGKEECASGLDQHWLVLCPHCQAPQWLDELEGYEDLSDDDEDEFPGLPEEGWPDLDLEEGQEELLNEPLDFAIPAFADYLAVLPSIKKFPEKTFELRLRAWWAGNDMRRGQPATPLTPVEAENLETFIGLLNAGNAYEQYLKAEALRELGRFAEASAVLDAIDDPDMARAVGIVRGRVEAGDAVVALLVGNA